MNDDQTATTITPAELWKTLDRHAHEVPIEELTELLGRLPLTADDVRDHVQFDPDHYCRNLLHCGAGYCALILCWLPGQASPIHDHRGSGCAVKVLQGTASETKYELGDDGTLTPIRRNEYPLGHVCGSFDADIHVMFNDMPEGNNLVTMHVYTPPLREVRMYKDTGVEIWTDEVSCAAQADILRKRS